MQCSGGLLLNHRPGPALLPAQLQPGPALHPAQLQPGQEIIFGEIVILDTCLDMNKIISSVLVDNPRDSYNLDGIALLVTNPPCALFFQPHKLKLATLLV